MELSPREIIHKTVTCPLTPELKKKTLHNFFSLPGQRGTCVWHQAEKEKNQEHLVNQCKTFILCSKVILWGTWWLKW